MREQDLHLRIITDNNKVDSSQLGIMTKQERGTRKARFERQRRSSY